MSNVIPVCLVLITIAVWTGLILLIVASLAVHRAAQAIEVKTYELGDHLRGWRDAASAASRFASVVRSRWFRGLGLALGAATTFYGARTRRRHYSTGKPADAPVEP